MKYRGIWIVISTIILVGFTATLLTRSYTEKQTADDVHSASSLALGSPAMMQRQGELPEEPLPETDKASMAEAVSVLERLEELDAEIADRSKSAQETSPNSLKAEAERERKLWEAELDRILGMLENVLDTDEKNALFQEQIEWTRKKETTAIETSSKISIAARKELQYNRTLIEITRDRAYELERRYRELLPGNLDN